jgi:hypothetical protein
MARYLDRWTALAALMAATAVACGNDAEPAAAPAPTSIVTANVPDKVPDALSGVTGGPVPSTTATTTAPVADTRGTSTTAAPAATATTAPADRRSSIVTLAGTWSPESQLGAAALADQRARIEAVQDEVVRALAGHGTLTQRLTETAQLVVSADPTGLTVLTSHPRVKSVQPNLANAPSTSS